MRHPLVALVAALALGAGCAAGEGYDPDWGATELAAEGKADGLFDTLEQLEFGGVGSGFVGGQQVDLYVMDLREQDEFSLDLSVLSGDLNPHVSLFYGSSTYIHSQRWERVGDHLLKWYAAPNAGRYLVAVRAYEGEGEGRYRLTATCNGGPCDGEFVEPTGGLNAQEAATCIMRARLCSFERMARYDGAVGDARSRSIFEGCLSESATDEGMACESACSVADGAQGLCDHIMRGIVFFADQSEACLATFDSCMSDCYGYAEYSYFDEGEFWETAENICLSDGFNGNCDSYARNQEVCGGEFAEESYCGCHDRCESTTGAWNDDLDTLCGDECGSPSDWYDEECSEACDGDPECIQLCLYENTDDCW